MAAFANGLAVKYAANFGISIPSWLHLAGTSAIRTRRGDNADRGADPGHSADHHSAVPAGIAGMAAEEIVGDDAAAEYPESYSRRSFCGPTAGDDDYFRVLVRRRVWGDQQIPQIRGRDCGGQGDGEGQAAAGAEGDRAESGSELNQGAGILAGWRKMLLGDPGGVCGERARSC